MSPLFLKFFRNEVKCWNCSAHKKEGYSVCPKHLRQAKMRWRHWSQERRGEGKCCYCNRGAYKGWLRCWKHTRINRVKCREWVARNKDRQAQAWRNRKEKYVGNGKCPSCSQHRKLTQGFHRCWTCRKRFALMERNIQVSLSITQSALVRLCKENRVQIRNALPNI
jgi:hypothetical protein